MTTVKQKDDQPPAAGERLRATRELQGRSLRSVAKATNYDASYISRVERGTQRPSIDLLRALAHELGLKDMAAMIDAVWDGHR